MRSIKRYQVTGRVQGVGFRYFVLREATELGVDGWVRNRGDGTVEALVGCTEDLHEQMLSRLEEGPRFSRVESVVVADEPGGAVDTGFRIRRDGA